MSSGSQALNANRICKNKTWTPLSKGSMKVSLRFSLIWIHLHKSKQPSRNTGHFSKRKISTDETNSYCSCVTGKQVHGALEFCVMNLNSSKAWDEWMCVWWKHAELHRRWGPSVTCDGKRLLRGRSLKGLWASSHTPVMEATGDEMSLCWFQLRVLCNGGTEV